MDTIIVISILALAILLLILAILKTLIPLAKKKDISLFLAYGAFIISINM